MPSWQRPPAPGLAAPAPSCLNVVFLQDGSGKVSLRMLQKYASQFGGETLTLEDLQGLFQDFKPSTDGLFEVREFLMFFSRVSRMQPLLISSRCMRLYY